MTSFQDYSREKMKAGLRDARAVIRRVETLSKTWAGSHWLRAACFCLFSAVATALVAGLVVHLAYVKHLDSALVRAEAGALASELDAAIKARSSALRIAISSLEPHQGLNSGALEHLMTGFGNAFPDLLSLEILNEQGELLAMIGDLPLSEAGKPTAPAVSRDRGIALTDAFGDDPAQNCFFVAQEERMPEGEKWLARARFSRVSIDKVLSSMPGARVVGLVRASEMRESEARGVTEAMAGLWGFWSRPMVAEARLAAPGWFVRLERQTRSGMFSCLLAMAAVSIALMGLVLYIIPRIVPEFDWPRAPEERVTEPDAEMVSVHQMLGPDDGSERQLELDFKRGVEAPVAVTSDVRSEVVPGFRDIKDAGPQVVKCATREIVGLAAYDVQSGEMPELLEITWDEVHCAHHSATPINYDKSGKFAVP